MKLHGILEEDSLNIKLCQIKKNKIIVILQRTKSYQYPFNNTQPKYDLTHSKTYKGSRTKFSSPKLSRGKATKPVKRRTTKKSSKKKRNYSRNNNNYSNSYDASSSLSISGTDQRIRDFRMIATACDKKMAANLLRNAVKL